MRRQQCLEQVGVIRAIARRGDARRLVDRVGRGRRYRGRGVDRARWRNNHECGEGRATTAVKGLGGRQAKRGEPRAVRAAQQAAAMEEQGVVVRRVMDADNSCLFNAVGYVTERSRDKGAQLRQVIARVVAGDEQRFTEAVLDKPNAAYCQWIARADSWGGGIELAILSDHFAKKIAAFDIQTKRCDVYGQDKPYCETIMLIYDGIHYDALALSPCEGAPEDFDQTIFPATAPHPLPPAGQELYRHGTLCTALCGLPARAGGAEGSSATCTSIGPC
ncbi:unnamed protein product [Closterium sp. NIES-54]